MPAAKILKGHIHVKENSFLSSLFKSYTRYLAELSDDGLLTLSPTLQYMLKTARITCTGKIMNVVTPDNKSFSIQFDSTAVLEKWKKEFVKIGAQEGGGSQSPKKSIFSSKSLDDGDYDDHDAAEAPKHFLESTSVEKWDPDHVIEWLSFLRTETFERMDLHYALAFKTNDVSGEHLLKMDAQQLEIIGVQNAADRAKLCKEITKLVKNKTFSMNEYKIVTKLEALGVDVKSVGDINTIVEALSDVEALKKKYLNFDIDDDEVIQQEKESTDGISFMGQENHVPQLTKSLRVKLLVSELVHSDKVKSFRKIVSPFVSIIPSVQPKFGIFHTAVTIGPWLIEWTDSSLCIPKKIAGSMVILAVDVDDIICSGHTKLNDKLDQLAQLIVDWNINRTYCLYRLQGKNPNEGNCQDFVDAVMQTFGLKSSFSGAVSSFLEEMKMNGCCSPIFKPDAKFIQECKLPENFTSVEFTSHQQLDDFVNKIVQANPFVKVDFSSEFALLKSFDRAFWIRHFQDTENPNYKQHKCMFGNPTAPQQGSIQQLH